VNVKVYFTPAEVAGLELPERVVVIDVLRATSTIVEALANGARAILPVATADEAARIAQSIGRDSVLLCGERKALPIEGFDLGNAPAEFTAEQVADKSLVMTTTNGTRAFVAVGERRSVVGASGGAAGGGAAGAKGGSAASGAVGAEAEAAVVLAGAFLNLSAVIARLASRSAPTALVCAGREGRFALEDAVCAGAVVHGLESAGASLDLNDGAMAARSLASHHMGNLQGMLELTDAGRHLMGVGRGEDLAFCAALDRTDVVPRFQDRKITLE
jgi:2-phosphosulfolactate phosphatase